MHRLVIYLLAGSAFLGTAAADSGLNVVISNTTAPAGTATQIQFYLAKPAAISFGELSVDLDPAVFGAVISVAAFGASGNTAGYAIVNGLHVDVNFRSAGGISGNPIVVLNAAIRPDAVPGTRATITADPSSTTWRDLAYQPLPVLVTPGSVTIGSAFSVSSVQPGSGILPAGAVIRVDGAGFSAATTVEIQAAVLSSTEFVSATQVNVTLAGPTEISGKRVRVRNSDGAQVDFFPCYWSGNVLSTLPGDPFVNAFPILPLQAYRQAVTASFRVFSGWLVLQNPNSDPVDVVLQVLQSNYSPSGQTALRIPAGEVAYQSLSTLGIPLENTVRVLASAPIRSLELSSYTNYFGSQPAVPEKSIAMLSPIDLGPLRVEADRGGDQLAWIWQAGGARPANKSFQVRSADRDQPAAFAVSVATQTGGKWLSATPTGATTCGYPSGCTDPSITASVDPSALAPGIYRGSITLTPTPTTVRLNVVPTVVAVALTVSSTQVVNNVVSWGATFVNPGPPGFSNSQPFNISTDIFPGPFSVAVHADSGGNWLSATPSTGTTPAVVTVSGDLSSLPPGRYSGEVILTGGGNTMVIPAMAFVYGGLQLRADYPLTFSVRAGDPAPPAQVAAVVPECLYCSAAVAPGSVPFSAFVKTNSGGNWLFALPSANAVSVSVNSSGLAPGVYTAAITLASNAVAGNTQIPVVLNVWSGSAPALSASPSSVFSVWYGGSGGGYLCVSAGSTAIGFDARATTSDGGDWLKVSLQAPVTFSCGVSATFDGSRLVPGTYTGGITVTAAGQSLSVPVTFVVLTTPRPMLGSVVNAASSIEGPVAAGEIVTIHGAGIGASPQVLFDGTPAPLLYSSDSQINAVVPSGVSGKAAVTIQVRDNGESSGWMAPVAPAALGIFTLDATGAGASAVLNQDNSLNGAANPAPRGSVIQIFAAGVTPYTGAPLIVNIGGQEAVIQYAGQAPGAVAGLFQVNAVVPAAVAAGPAIPILFSIGPWTSQNGATISVQ